MQPPRLSTRDARRHLDSLKSRLLFLTSSSSATSRSLHCRCCSSSPSSSCFFSSRRCFWRDDAAPRSGAPPPVDLVGRVRGLAGLSEGSAGCCCCCCCWRTFLTSEGRRERDHFSPQHCIGSPGCISVYGACSRDAYKRNGPAQLATHSGGDAQRRSTLPQRFCVLQQGTILKNFAPAQHTRHGLQQSKAGCLERQIP